MNAGPPPAFGQLRVIGPPPGRAPSEVYLVISSDMVNQLGQGVLAVPVRQLELDDDPVSQVIAEHGVASLYEIHHWPHSWIGNHVGDVSEPIGQDVVRKIHNLIGR